MRSISMRRLACWAALALGPGVGCGGSDGSGVGHNPVAAPADNVAELSVDYGLPGIGYVNGLFTTVTVCVPGTSDCQSIDHLIVDTGSSGLRVLGSVLALSLPASTNASGGVLAECDQLLSGFTWGPLRLADLTIAGERASSLPIQVIEESTYPVPSDCTGVDADTAEVLGSNGILGVASDAQDCGTACTARPGSTSNPGIYYACSSAEPGGCSPTAVPLAQQMTNPVTLFPQDNNGTIIELPAVPAQGAPQVTGSLVFGIGTRANNGLGQAGVLHLNNYGMFTTRYPAGSNLWYGAILDSGSNFLYFLDSPTTDIPLCPDPNSFLYCPASTMNLSATNQDSVGLAAVTVKFSIANLDALSTHPQNIAFNNIGGPSTMPDSASASDLLLFDWGMPFFFGRNVYTAIEDRSTPSGAGPFVAF